MKNEIWGNEFSQLWFVTFVTYNSRKSQRMIDLNIKIGNPVVFSTQDRKKINDLILSACHEHEITLLAISVLRDHVHLIMEAENEDQLNEHVRKIKGFTSFQYQQGAPRERRKRIWAQKFHRKPIIDEEALKNILHYIEFNPEKHNLR